MQSISTYEHRLDFLRKYVPDKDVLEIGPAELVGTTNRNKLERWPHQIIKDLAKSLSGLEKNLQQVRALQEQGYNIFPGDAENFDLGRRYDVIFAGEVIEHLSNPGQFLQCACKHLHPGGILLITTPNRFSMRALKSVILENKVQKYRQPIDGHTAYYDIRSLEHLLEREGFLIKELGYYLWFEDSKGGNGLTNLVYSFLKRFRCHLLPGIVATATPVEIELSLTARESAPNQKS